VAAGAAAGGARLPRLRAADGRFEKYIVERDIVVPLSDGGQVIVNVYRTPGLTDLPAVISWSPYGKHKSQKDLVALMLRDAAAFLHSDGVNLTLLLKAAKFIRASL